MKKIKNIGMMGEWNDGKTYSLRFYYANISF